MRDSRRQPEQRQREDRKQGAGHDLPTSARELCCVSAFGPEHLRIRTKTPGAGNASLRRGRRRRDAAAVGASRSPRANERGPAGGDDIVARLPADAAHACAAASLTRLTTWASRTIGALLRGAAPAEREGLAASVGAEGRASAVGVGVASRATGQAQRTRGDYRLTLGRRLGQ